MKSATAHGVAVMVANGGNADAVAESSNILSYLRGEIYDAQNFVNPEVFKGR